MLAITVIRWRRLIGVVAITALVAAGCGGDDAAPTTQASPTTAPSVGQAPADSDDEVAAELAAVNLATAAFQDVAAAGAAGYEPFLECISDPTLGGMGQHYVNMDLLDGVVDATAPEAVMYEVTPDGLILVGVEYVVPAEAWTADTPPSLFGQDYHFNEALGIWALHAWIWKDNPAGMFADFNPKVRLCP